MNITQSDVLVHEPFDDEELALWSLDDLLDLAADAPSSSIDQEIIEPTWSTAESDAPPQAATG